MSFTKNWQELGSSTLFAEHRKYLKDRSVSTEVIKLNNLRSLTPDQTAVVWPGHKCEVLLAPYSDTYGSGRAFDDSKAKFLSPRRPPERDQAWPGENPPPLMQ